VLDMCLGEGRKKCVENFGGQTSKPPYGEQRPILEKTECELD
jgi:hypothetical protein